jgi:hypothetical protein
VNRSDGEEYEIPAPYVIYNIGMLGRNRYLRAAFFLLRY